MSFKRDLLVYLAGFMLKVCFPLFLINWKNNLKEESYTSKKKAWGKVQFFLSLGDVRDPCGIGCLTGSSVLTQSIGANLVLFEAIWNN